MEEEPFLVKNDTDSMLNQPPPADKLKKLVALLEEEDVAYDIGSYRDAPPGLRIWCGATVEEADVAKLTPWIEWAYNEVA